MSATEDAVATNQAPPSPAPSNPDKKSDAATADGAADGDVEVDANPNGDAPAPAEDTPAADAPNGKADAPKSSRTSARAKAASSSAPASKKEDKPKADKPKPRASTSGGPPAPSKKAGASKGDKEKGFTVGDIVLGRLKGYPAWPARVADPDNIPRKVVESRPSKNPSIYCVQFFPVGDYAWLNAREITSLTPSDISSYLAQGHRKGTGGLHEAFQTAQDPTEWDEGQKEILEQQAAEADGVDELEEEDDAEADEGGKRKKSGASKPKKKAKTEKKEEPAKSKSKAAAKPKSAAAKSAKAPESKPADKDAAGDDEGSNDPESIKVKDWRHKLQRAFLGKSVPTADEMPTYDDLFKTIEEYTGMTIEALQYSKIGKVMKKIAAMDNIPRNDEFTITDRAQKLMNDWHTYIESKQEGGANGDAKDE